MEILYYKSLANTNTTLLELSKKNAKHLTALWTDNQSEGRGYAGNKWMGRAGENIALSLLTVSDLGYNELVYFNQWISVVVADILKAHTPEIYVKWPNDIIADDNKLCGILIETRRSDNLLYVVSGIGINVNQVHFENQPKAVSLSMLTGQKFDLKKMVSDILAGLVDRYSQIENKDWHNISKAYVDRLYKKNEICSFKSAHGLFEASIEGVSSEGELILKTSDGIERKFVHKSIEMLY
ncbi:MAG: biotin--[acetyl-CoA-carboxylase] ligase [Weeksellaceae bacterium]|jgi:BirA family biotin operon repressor/biotin-[acetyl-CoA-carboxylase] ligase|nr:biotin--[acetyl-CoA-carboxylase] ligase [Weeksellaceae bacterium]